jgi:hypothetical protein
MGFYSWIAFNAEILDFGDLFLRINAADRKNK